MINLTHLRAFHAVATTGGFHQAAAVMHISQPTLSEQVRAIERRYQVLLFDRVGRRVVLTELGAELLGIAQRLFDLESDAELCLSNAKELRVGQVKLGADAPVHAMPLLAALRRRYPGLSVQLWSGNSEEIQSLVLSARVDLGITATAPVDERLSSIELWRDNVVAFVPVGHPLAKRRSVGVPTLLKQELVVREAESVTRRVFEHGLAAMGASLERSPHLLQVDSREAVQAAVSVGLGVGVVSEREFTDDPRLVKIKISGFPYQVVERLVCRKDRRRARIVDTVLALAVQASADQDQLMKES